LFIVFLKARRNLHLIISDAPIPGERRCGIGSRKEPWSSETKVRGGLLIALSPETLPVAGKIDLYIFVYIKLKDKELSEMKVTESDIFKSIGLIRSQSPVVHNITNYVVMNNTANALLAIGASPVMAHAQEEVEEMVDIASALVINIGTLSEHWISSMFKAAHHARKKASP